MPLNILISGNILVFNSYAWMLMRSVYSESPLPKHPDLFSSFPSLAAGERCVPNLSGIPRLLNVRQGPTNHTAALKRQTSIVSKRRFNTITYDALLLI